MQCGTRRLSGQSGEGAALYGHQGLSIFCCGWWSDRGGLRSEELGSLLLYKKVEDNCRGVILEARKTCKRLFQTRNDGRREKIREWMETYLGQRINRT